MARLLYGATGGDAATTPNGRLVPGATLSVHTEMVGGTQVTDLLDYNGDASSVAVADEYGLVRFWAPDGTDANLWIDGGTGPRTLVRPTILTAEITNNSITNADIYTAADIDPTKIDGTALTAATVGTFNVKHYGATGDGETDDTDAIQDALDAAAAATGVHGTQRAAVYFPRGIYLTDRFTVPGRVSLHGDGHGVARLVTNETDGGHFCVFTGSFSDAVGLTFDGQRSAQSGTPIGLSAVLFARPNATTGGGGDPISGGLVLDAAVDTDDTSIVVTDDSPGGEQIVAGEYITLVEDTTYELARVAPTYAGGLTIPLETAVLNEFTVDAKVSVASTHNTIRYCRVLGNGRDGIAFWHNVRSSARRNLIEDYEDSGIDFPDAGSRWCDATENHMETKGRWGVAFDTASSDFGPVADCVSRNNFIRFLTGGDGFTNGGALDGIYMGVTERCVSDGDHIDITLDGRSGVYLVAGAVDPAIRDLTVDGPATPRDNTWGITCASSPTRLAISGGHLSGTKDGIRSNETVHVAIRGVKITNVSDYGVNVIANSSMAQRISVVGVHCDTNVAGVRFGGTPNVGNAVSVTGCVLLNSSYAAITADGGWNKTETGNV